MTGLCDITIFVKTLDISRRTALADKQQDYGYVRLYTTLVCGLHVYENFYFTRNRGQHGHLEEYCDFNHSFTFSHSHSHSLTLVYF